MHPAAHADYDVIILGGGLSGLSLAHRAVCQGYKVLVAEKDAQVGGCMRSSGGEETGEAEPFWLELGSHTCYNSYVNLISLIEDCGLMERIRAREKLSYVMLTGGKLRSIPSQLGIPELLRSAPRLLAARREGQTMRSFYARIVGERNYDRVMGPLFNAVACQDASDIAVEYLFKKRPGRRKDVLRNFTLTGGMQTLTKALAATPGLTLRTGAAAVAVTRDAGVFRVRLEDGSLHTSRFLGMALPPSAAARLLGDCAPEVAHELAAIRMCRVSSIGVVVRREAVALPRVAGIVSVGDRFTSVVSRDVVPHPTYRGFTFHFREDDLNANIRRIEEVLGVGEHQFERVEVQTHAMPTLGVGHAEVVRRLDALLEGSALLLTGNYYLGLSLEDCVSRSFSEAERLERLFAAPAPVEVSLM